MQLIGQSLVVIQYCQAQGHLLTFVNSCEVYKPQKGVVFGRSDDGQVVKVKVKVSNVF